MLEYLQDVEDSMELAVHRYAESNTFPFQTLTLKSNQCDFYKLLYFVYGLRLTSRVLVTGNIKARRAPLRKFRCMRNVMVTVRLGGAANIYI